MRFSLAVLALALVACAHHSAPPARHELELSGLSAQLLPEPSVRAAVSGDVQGTYAEVRFDYAEPLTLVTRGCFPNGDIADSGEVVNVPQPTGEERKLTLVGVSSLTIASKPLGALRAGLLGDEKHCTVTLGSDVLIRYALTIDPATRRLTVERTRTHDDYVAQLTAAQSSDELHLIDLTRDPNSDWPLLAVRATQPNAQVTGAFLLSLTAIQSGVVDQAAGEAGLQPREIFSGLPPVTGGKESKRGAAFDLTGLELSPGFGIEHVALQMLSGWTKPVALGVLGADVWGHFRATIDPMAGVLLLGRARVFAAGSRQQCATKGTAEISEEACFQLEQLPQSRGVDAVVTLWRDAPEGARVYLETLDEKGVPVPSDCRVGVSFLPADRGISLRHRIPWESIQKTLPQCAEQLAAAKKVALALYQDGALPECPGNCGFIQDVTTRRVSCECAPTGLGMSEMERRLLDIERMMKKEMPKTQQKQTPPEEGPEDDPQK
ncbi:MAG: hypothetical protein ACJ790_22100 [Myxococcaceae bacterium]